MHMRTFADPQTVRFASFRRRRIAGVLALLGATMPVALARAQEYSLIDDSTVIGRNWGYPSGTARPGEEVNPEGRTPVGKVDLVLETVVFFKNLELDGFDSSSGIDGETFFGFLAPTRLRWRAHERLTFEGGAVLGQNFGDEDSLDIAEPLVRLVYEPVDDVFVIGGTILPTHPIHDALLDDVHVFRETEQGLQVRVDRASWKNDTWINWRIREDELTAEEFEVGNATQVRPLEGLHVDAQLLWYHVGGQKNSADRVENHVAGLLGASYGVPGTVFAESATWLEDLRLGAAYLGSHNDTLADETGSGWEVVLSADFRPAENWRLRAFASYFSGDDYLGVRGDPLYALDDYSQVGVNNIWQLPAGFRAEAGGVVQLNDDNTNYTFLVNLAWGGRLTIPLTAEN
jgi:hypothetical protein